MTVHYSGKQAEDAERMAALGFRASAIRAILQAGYDLEWVQQATPQDLTNLYMVGEASARDIFFALGRHDEWQKSGIDAGRPKRDQPIIVTTHGAAAGSVDEDEIAANAEAEIDAVLAELQEAYEADTPNDQAALRALARSMYLRREIQNRMVEAAVKQNVGHVDALTKTTERLTREIIAIEKQLEIDAGTRRKLQATRRDDEVIAGLIEATKEFRAQRIRHIQHCGVLLGYVVAHFPEHFPRTMQVICPVCNKPFEAEIVTEYDLSLYVAAGDFLPKGAPRTMGSNVKKPILPEMGVQELLDYASETEKET